MRKVVATLFALLLFTPAMFARGKHDWEQAEKLKHGTPVLISLWSGRTISGRVESVDPATIQIDTADPDVGVGSLIDFGRTDIRRIVRIRQADLPNPGRWMLTGLLVGGGIGLAGGAIYDIAHHEDYHWFTGGLGGAGVGFFASCAVLAGVGVIDVVKLFHHRTVVYEDEGGGQVPTNRRD